LRHSLRFKEDEVLSLIECTETCPTPSSRQPTKANILAGLRWLTRDALPNDSLFLFFSGYGAQVPVLGQLGAHQGCLVPADFAEDLPRHFFQVVGQAAGSPQLQQAAQGASYRLVTLAEVTAALGMLHTDCKATVVLDCCHGVVPHVSGSDPMPFTFQRTELDVQPEDVLENKHGAMAERPWRPRLLRLPLLPMPAPLFIGSPGSPPQCRCHCYAACRAAQWCAELPIEGCVQGAFTWAFVKAFTAGRLDTSVNKHMNALRSILGNLRAHFRWLDQSPQLQLSGSADMQDNLLEH